MALRSVLSGGALETLSVLAQVVLGSNPADESWRLAHLSSLLQKFQPDVTWATLSFLLSVVL